MSHLVRRELLFAALSAIVVSAGAQAQAPSVDSLAYRSVRLDSSDIRRLPLSRSAEITSFLPGSALGISSYNAGFIGAVGTPDIRIDGVPALNVTRGNQLLALPAFALSNVEGTLTGSSVRYGNLVSVRYNSMTGGSEWSGFANASTDAAMPGSIGNLRIAGGGGGPLARSWRAAVNFSAQSADATEFNNIRDVRLFEMSGIDTTISISTFDGGTRDVTVFGFSETDVEKLPASGWNEQLAAARLDFLPSPKSNAFVAGYFTRLQEREAFGGGCIPCALYTSAAHRGARIESSMVTLGLDHALGTRASAHIRLSRATDESTRGVLTDGSSGLLDQFSFLLDDDRFPVTDELIEAYLHNSYEDIIPFPGGRNDLFGASEFRMNPYGMVSGFWTQGVENGTYAFNDESRLFGSAILKGGFSAHEISVGAEMTTIDARFIETAYTSSFNGDVWKEGPSLFSAFVADVVELGQLTVQAGVRYDSFDPKSRFPLIPGYLIPTDPSTYFDAPRTSALSPRIAVAATFGKVALHSNFGQAGVVPVLSRQYALKNVNFLIFQNASYNAIFGAPLEIYKVTSGNLGGVLQATSALQFELNGYVNGATDAPLPTRTYFDDPTNPGVPSSLNTWANRLSEAHSGFAASARYTVTPRTTAGISMSHGTMKLEVDDANTVLLDDSRSVTSVVGLAQLGSDRIPGNVDITLALRANKASIYDDPESTWVTRFDGRIAKHVAAAGLRGSVFIDGLRLLGNTGDVERFLNDTQYQQLVAQARVLLAGSLSDNVNLTSLQTAGDFYIANEVDLYLLQRAEARFGNGDKMFSAAEQIAAFGASVQLQARLAAPLGQSRRFILGAQLSF